VTYSLSGTDASSFDIDSSGKITAKDGVTLDYETDQSYSVVVEATDSNGHENTANVVINLSDVNEAPTASSISSLSGISNQSFSNDISSKVLRLLVVRQPLPSRPRTKVD